jgi:hypothetical protein
MVPPPPEEAPPPRRIGFRSSAEQPKDVTARRAFVESLLGFFKSRGAALPWSAPTDGALVQRLAGLCAMADWIGSDADHHPYQPAPADLDLCWTEAVKRSSVACELAGLIRSAPAASTFIGLFPDVLPWPGRQTPILSGQGPDAGSAGAVDGPGFTGPGGAGARS